MSSPIHLLLSLLRYFYVRTMFLKQIYTCFFDKKNSPLPITPSKEKTLLVIRIDAIGDYMLYRNFLALIKQSEKYRSYRLIFLGNKICQGIAEEYDSDMVDEFIWADRKQLMTNKTYRKEMLLKLSTYAIDEVFYPAFSREYFMDHLIKQLCIPIKLSVNGDHRNTTYMQKQWTTSYYTSLLEIPKSILFEFDKNKAITEAFIQEPVSITKPTIRVSVSAPLATPYAIIFPDASLKKKQWHPHFFGEVAAYLSSKKQLSIVLAGTNEKASSATMEASQLEQVVNMTKKTSLPELINLIGHASIIISNDTVALHIAAATNTPFVAVFNGALYGRFIPYPRAVFHPSTTVIPQTFTTKNKSFTTLAKKFKQGNFIDINKITPLQVIQAIESL